MYWLCPRMKKPLWARKGEIIIIFLNEGLNGDKFYQVFGKSGEQEADVKTTVFWQPVNT